MSSLLILLFAFLSAGLSFAENPLVSSAPAAGTTLEPNLPGEIRETLNSEYPGWVFAPIAPSVRQRFLKYRVPHPPQLVAADFDRDGKSDYAVQIALTTLGEEEQIVIAFMQRESGFEETVVESRGLNPSVYLRTRKERPTSADPSAATEPRDLLIVVGGEVGESHYRYEGGGFKEARPPEATPARPRATPAVREDL